MVNSKQRKPKALSWRGLAFPVCHLQRRRRDLTGHAVADLPVFRGSPESVLQKRARSGRYEREASAGTGTRQAAFFCPSTLRLSSSQSTTNSHPREDALRL